MNATTLLIGLASGAASASLSVALNSGSLFAVFLFLFAALPVYISGIGWHHIAGLVAAVSGAGFIYLLMGGEAALAHALSVGLPAWWLAYLALLGQPADPDHPEQGLIWYPVGRLIAWAAALGAGLMIVTIAINGGSVEEYRAMLRATFETFLRAETGTAPDANVTLPGGGDASRMTDIAVILLPPLAAAVWTTVALINMWVAGRVVRASGRLMRPWPDISAFHLPGMALIALVGGVVLSAFPGLFGFVAGVIAATFAVAFAALGLSVLHVGTRGTAGRGIMLGATYVLLAIQTWIVVLVALLGVVEFLFGIRARIAAARSQPPKPTL